MRADINGWPGWQAGACSLLALAALLLLIGQAGPAYSITIDPIPDRYVGDRFTVTATTNLPAGEAVLFRVSPSSSLLRQGQVPSEWFTLLDATLGGK